MRPSALAGRRIPMTIDGFPCQRDMGTWELGEAVLNKAILIKRFAGKDRRSWPRRSWPASLLIELLRKMDEIVHSWSRAECRLMTRCDLDFGE